MRLQAEVSSLVTYGIIFVVLAVVLSIGAYILSSISTTAAFGANTVANTTLVNGQSALKTFSTWLPILAVVIVSAIIIYLLINVFRGEARGGR